MGRDLGVLDSSAADVSLFSGESSDTVAVVDSSVAALALSIVPGLGVLTLTAAESVMLVVFGVLSI